MEVRNEGMSAPIQGVTPMHKRSRGDNEHTFNGSFRAVKGDVHDRSLRHNVIPLAQNSVRVDDGSCQHIGT